MPAPKLDKILKTVTVGTVNKGGRDANLTVVTRTQTWARPNSISSESVEELKQAVDEMPSFPKHNATVALRETTHRNSKGDQRAHMTVAFMDDKGNHLTTLHLESPTKPKSKPKPSSSPQRLKPDPTSPAPKSKSPGQPKR